MRESEIQAEILKEIGALLGVQVMRINSGLFETKDGRRVRAAKKGAHDILISVKVAVARLEKITSGSMMFDHNRYYTFGQIVWMEVKVPGKSKTDDQKRFGACWEEHGGAITCVVTSKEEAKYIIENLADYIPRDKDVPKNCILI